jgi:predicted SAM-dependent methyltransferase
MKKIHLVSYADGEDYIASGQRTMESARLSGQFASVTLWTKDMIEATDWYQQHPEYQDILARKKGAGLWAWKSLVFCEALKSAGLGEYVMWHDAGRSQYRYWDRFQKMLPLDAFADHVQEQCGGLYVAPSTYLQRHWTKKACLNALECFSLSHPSAPQFCAYFIFASVSETALKFATQWLEGCSRLELIEDPSDLTLENKEFRGHRWEQSIMTTLLYRFHEEKLIRLNTDKLFPPPIYRDLHMVINTVLTPDSGRHLHIGGTKKKAGWEILNIVPGAHVDHVGDARDLSLFPDNTFTELYASHILEHFGYVKYLNPLLKEWCRVITPGGRLRISVPDLEKLSGIILDKSIGFKDRFMAMRMMFGGQSNEYDFHHVGFTFEILSLYLTSNGFGRILQVNSFDIFADSSDKVLAGKKISLNIEAWKR